MTLFAVPLGALLAALLAVLPAGPARAAGPAPAPAAATTASPGIAPADAGRVLDLLKDDKRRAELERTLETLARVAPAVAPGPATPAGTAPAPQGAAGAPAATAAPGAPAAPTTPVVPAALAPDSVGAQVLVSVSETLSQLSDEATQGLHAVKSLPAIWVWLETMATDPLARDVLIETAWRLVLAFAIALAVEWGLWRALAGPRRVLARHAPGALRRDETGEAAEPGEAEEATTPPPETGERAPRRRRVSAWTLLRRLPIVLAILALNLIPIAAFATAGHVVAASPLGGTNLIKLVLLAVVDAYAISRTLTSVAAMMLSPEDRRLRMLHWPDHAAAYAMRWLRRIVVIAVFGYAGAEVGLLLGLTTPAHDALIKAVALVVHVCIAIVVLEKRRAVARWIRPREGAHGFVALVRTRLAAIWHWIALFYVVSLWLVWAIEIRDGYTRMLNFFVVTIATLIVARLTTIVALGTLDRALHVRPETAKHYPGLDARARVYHPILRIVLTLAMSVLALLTMFQFWGLHVLGWLTGTTLGVSVLSSLLTIAVTLALALATWEGANIAIELHLARLTREAQGARSARLRTLLPLLRTLLLGAVLVIAGLMVLSQIGVNIAPLLAGAGILGVAIGFGSQKLVQDLITGIFLLLENAMQVGDWVTVSGLSGTVEALSVRTIRLRAGDGSVHIIPFSAVTSVTNTNRGLGNASVNVSVAFSEDTDRVSAVLREIVAEMRREPDFSAKILSDLQLWGVDKVDGSSVTIVGQIVCTDSGRWSVQREFNRRLKRRFQERGIEIYNPSQQYILEQPAVPSDIAARGQAAKEMSGA